MIRFKKLNNYKIFFKIFFLMKEYNKKEKEKSNHITIICKLSSGCLKITLNSFI